MAGRVTPTRSILSVSATAADSYRTIGDAVAAASLDSRRLRWISAAFVAVLGLAMWPLLWAAAGMALVPIAFADHVRAALPRAEHLVLPGGHVPQLESPRRTHDALQTFLARG